MNERTVFWLSRLSFAGLLALLVYGLVSLFWFLTAPPKPMVGGTLAATTSSEPKAQNFNLFSSATSQSLRLPQGLTLEGVMLSSNAADSRAFFKMTSGVFGVKTGAKLEGTGLSLGKVEAQRAQVFDTGGASGWIELERRGLELNQPLSTQGSSVSSTSSMPPREAINMSGAERLSRALRGRSSEASTEDALSRMSEDPQKFVEEMGLVASGNGYQITGSTSQRTRARYGLRPGDQVISINGHTLGDPTSDAQMIESLNLNEPLEVVIQRGSGTLTLRPKIK